MTTIDNADLVKISNSAFHCNSCDYTAHRKFNFILHLQSNKHKNNVSNNENNGILAKNSRQYECPNCTKTFNDRAGLWRHKKKCIKPDLEPLKEPIKEQTINDHDLIMMLIKDNSELKQMMIKVLEIGTHNTTNTNTNTNSHNVQNSHNKAFNLQFFLNETCKNAMNITDFVDSIKLQLSDLMEIGEKGYVESISKIIVNNLSKLEEPERPIHCTDKKRKTFYVKDQGHWEKEDEQQKRIKKAIKSISNKYFKLLPVYRAKYPDYRFATSAHSDEHSKIVIEVMVSDADKDDKIIHNVSKATLIRKEDERWTV